MLDSGGNGKKKWRNLIFYKKAILVELVIIWGRRFALLAGEVKYRNGLK